MSKAATVPTSFPELAAKSAEELLKLLTDEAAYQALLSSLLADTHSIQVSYNILNQCMFKGCL